MARSKYNVSKNKDNRTFDGIVFDSQMEMKYYRDIILPLMESGNIVKYERQKKFELQPKFTYEGKTIRAIVYVADFYITYKDGTTEVVEIKGMPDKAAPLKKKLFLYKYPEQKYRWLTYVNKRLGWMEYDEAQKLKKKEK